MIKVVSEPYKQYWGDGTQWCMVRNVMGLTCDWPRYWQEDGSIPVDVDIVDIVVKLNELGYTTGYCCSGLRSSHSAKKLHPYISFSSGLSNTVGFKLLGLMLMCDFYYREKWVFDLRKPIHLIIAHNDKHHDMILSKWNNLRKEIGIL